MDLSQYSDAELEQMLGESPDLSQYSDDDLYAMLPAPQEPERELNYSGLKGKAKAFGSGILDTASLGLSDEIKAAVAATTLGAYNLFDDTGVSWSEGYNQALSELRQEQAQMQEQQGGAYLGGQVVGSLLPYGSAAKGGMTVGKGARIGAAQGGLYGFGSGEGFEDRAFQGVVGGGLGAAGGAGGVLAGRGASRVAQTKPVRALTDRAVNAFKKKTPESSGKITVATNNALKSTGDEQGEVFTMTQGQRTQKANPQRLEADALAGLYGDEAERTMRLAQVEQSRERKAFLESLAKIEKGKDEFDIIEGVYNTIQSQSKKLKGKVNSAYDLAREGGGVKINVDDIQDGLFANVVKLKKEGQFDIGSMPLVKKPIKDLTRLVRGSQGGKFTSANLGAMENWRKGVTNAINSSNDGSEKTFLRGMLNSYDDFMYKTASEAVDKNDEAAILAFRDAVWKRREYGKLYESDRFVQDLVRGKKGLDDTVKDLIGTGSIIGKKRMNSTYNAIIKAAGDEGGLVKADLQSAFAHKLLNQSISGLEEGGEAAYLSAAKTKKALEGLFVNNREFSKNLYGEEATTQALKAIDELEKIANTQVATQNPSGSGQLVLRSMMRLPFLSTLKEGVDFTITTPIRAGQVAKSVDPVVSKIQNMKILPKSKMLSTAGGRLGAEKIDMPAETQQDKGEK